MNTHDHLIKAAIEEQRKLERAGLTADQLLPVSDYRDMVADAQKSVALLKSYGLIGNTIIPPWVSRADDWNKTLLAGIEQSAIKGVLAEASRISLTLGEHLAQHKDAWNSITESLARNITAFEPPLIEIRNHLVKSELLALSTNSLFAGRAANQIAEWGTAFDLSDSRSSFSTSVEVLSRSFKDLLGSFELPETSLFRLPASVAFYPSAEIVHSVSVAQLTNEGTTNGDSEIFLWQQEIASESKDSVIALLEQHNPGWVPMLAGAKAAIRSRTPDKVRHSVTSLRELMTHILHHLSPDKEVESWSTSTDDFWNGRPTRKARLKFIARHINHGPFTSFIKKDIEAVIALFDLFQPGTHSVDSPFTEAQVEALIARVEGAIIFIMKTDNPDI